MRIIPHIGVDDVRFGASEAEVAAILGPPSTQTKRYYPGLGHYRYWLYSEPCLSLTFWSVDAFKLSSILISNRTARLEKKKVIGRKIKTLCRLFPSIKRREDRFHDCGFFDDEERALSYYVECGRVVYCEIFAGITPNRHAMETANWTAKATA